MFASEDSSFNCAAYYIDRNCFNIHLVSKTNREAVTGKGLEFGEDNQIARDRFYNCLVKTGILGA